MKRLFFSSNKFIFFVFIVVFIFAAFIYNKTSNAVISSGGLAAYYTFEGNANDSAGGNNGVISGMPSYETGISGQAIVFNGLGPKILIPDNAAINPSSWTIGAWINYRSSASSLMKGAIIAKSDPTNRDYFLSVGDFTGVCQYRILNTGTVQVMGPANSIMPNVWTHVLCSYNISDNKLSLYINGKLVDSTIGAFSAPNNNFQLSIGSRTEDINPAYTTYLNSEIFNGLIDEALIYNYALSTSEILNLYDSYLSAPSPSDTTSPVTVASPAGGTYTSTQTVTLSRNESGTTYYTTNGSNPTISSTIYSSPINISQTTTLKFFSKDTTGNSETIKTENYTINSQSAAQPSPATLWQNALAHTTTRPHNRKLIYHPASGYYFAFYGTGAVKTNRWTSSTDGKIWSAGGVTNPVNGHGSSNDYLLDGNKIISVNAENGYGNPNTCYYKLKEWAISSGSLSNTSNKALASWTCPASVAGSPDLANEANAVGYGSMTKDTNGYYWIAALKGSNNTSSYIYVYRSPSPNTIAGTWANPILVDNFPVGTETAPDIIALDLGKMLLIMEEDDVNGGTTDNNIRVALYNGSNWEAPYTLFNNTQIANKMRTTAEFDPQTNKLHFLYEDASANLRHMTLSYPYGQSNWSAKPGVVVASGLKTNGEMDSSLEIDLTTSPASLYAIYVKSNGYYSINNYDGVSGVWTGEKTFGAQTGGEANEGSMIKEYQGKIAAVYSVNNGAGGRDVIFQEYATQSVMPPTPSDTTPPSAPTNLTATAISTSQINLSWSSSSDNAGVTGYKIYRNGSLFTIQNNQLTTYSNTGLTANTAYIYKVSAIDAAGNESGQSAQASVTTQAVTQQPTGIIFEDDFSNDVGWVASNSLSSSIESATANGCYGNLGCVAPPSKWNAYNVGASTQSLKIVANTGKGGNKPALQLNWGMGTAQRQAISLRKHLTGDRNSGYDELYIRYEVKFDNGWSAGNGTNIGYWKWFRLWQYRPPYGINNYGENQAPYDTRYAVAQLSNTPPSWGIVLNANYDGPSVSGPSWNQNYVTSSNPCPTCGFFESINNWDFNNSTGQFLNDPQDWHTVEWHIKLNTGTGNCDGTENGEYDVWLDGVKQDTAKQYINSMYGAPTGCTKLPLKKYQSGFNYLVLFDNFDDWASTWTTDKYLYLDNVVVSTAPIGVNYVVGNNTNAPSVSCAYTYSTWSTCQPNSTQTRIVISVTPSGCAGTPSLTQSCIYTAPDTTPPVISTPSATATTDSATITFTTNENSNSYVQYGLTSSYGQQTAVTNSKTSFSFTLSNLSSNTIHNYRITSTDPSGNASQSINYTFKTNQAAVMDITPPSAITNLSASNITQTSAKLNWTAPGDDGNVGIAASYDIRYSTSQITNSNWNTATQVNGEPNPSSSGSEDYVSVGLSPNATYYFAIKTSDEVNNISGLSNVISFKTLNNTPLTPSAPATPSAPSTPSSPGGGGGGSASGGGSYDDTTPPSQPKNFIAQGAEKQITLNWTNPVDSDFVRVKVLRTIQAGESSVCPGAHDDPKAELIYEGVNEEYTDVNLDNSKKYCYAIFAYDKKPNYSMISAATASPEAGKESIEKPKTQTEKAILQCAQFSNLKNMFGLTSAEVETITGCESRTTHGHNQYVNMDKTGVGIYVKLKEQISKFKDLVENSRYSIAYFIQEGTPTTKVLGSGERAGVISSFFKAYQKLPETESDWSDVIKIANGRWPAQTSEQAETEGKNKFKEIYLRDPNMANPNDNAAVTIIAYGLRPASRNMDSEKAAIKIFKSIFKSNPATALAWDIVRAIAYSGARR